MGSTHCLLYQGLYLDVDLLSLLLPCIIRTNLIEKEISECVFCFSESLTYFDNFFLHVCLYLFQYNEFFVQFILTNEFKYYYFVI